MPFLQRPEFVTAVFSRLLGIDRSIGYLLAARLVQVAFYAAVVVLVLRYLTANEQGYYYTFFSILALQAFVDLGLAIVIVSNTSHEWALLRTDSALRIVGDPVALARLVSLARVGVKWFGLGTLLFVPCVGLAGWLFFSAKPDPTVSWQGPWVVLVILTGLSIGMTPFNAVLEGCNQVAKVNRTKLEQAVLEGLAVCTGLLLGAGLWAAAISAAVRLCRNLYLVFIEYREFFRPFRFRTNSAQIDWFLEIWPMQWRLGVSGLVTYFLNSMYNPVMFHYHGADVAGQTGITLQVTTGLSIVAMSWITTKVPRFGTMIAQKQYAELDTLWQRVSVVSIAMITIGATAVWLLLYFGKAAGFGFIHRMLDPLPTAIFLIAAIVAQFVQCLVYYLRAHRREPIMVASVSISLGTGLLVWLLGKHWGPIGAASGYLMAITIGAVWIWSIWRHCRGVWHAS